MHRLSCSIVLYKNDVATVIKAISSILSCNLNVSLYLIDNSPTNEFEKLLSSVIVQDNVTYIFNNKNLGYGKGHNIALKTTIYESSYHLVLNPDIEFEKGTVEPIYDYMEHNKNVGLLMPKVLYKDGRLQKLCNPLPMPSNLISRRFFKNSKWAKKINDQYELKSFDYNSFLNVPNLSGCFMFLRCETLKKTGFFDERYFMYMEDVDLCRRIHAISKTIYYPAVKIVHGFEKESYSSKKLLKYHVIAAMKYFNKWGWIFDKQRDNFNKKLLAEISNPGL